MITSAIQIAVDVSNGKTHDAKTIEQPVIIDAKSLDQVKETLGYDPSSPY